MIFHTAYSGSCYAEMFCYNMQCFRLYFHCHVAFCFSSQLAYQAWVTSVKAALRERQRRQRQLRRTENKEKEREERMESQEEPYSVIG